MNRGADDRAPLRPLTDLLPGLSGGPTCGPDGCAPIAASDVRAEPAVGPDAPTADR